MGCVNRIVPVTVTRHDPGVDRLHEQRFERERSSAASSKSTVGRGHAAAYRSISCASEGREPTRLNEIVPEVPRDGERLARGALVPAERRARDLQGEERIPAGRLAQAHEDRPREASVQADPHELRQFVERQRSHGTPRHTPPATIERYRAAGSTRRLER